MLRRIFLAGSTLALAQTAYRYFLTGSAADASGTVSPGFVLMGGGKDVDRAFEWLIRKSGGGDIVVIRASGADGYNPYIPGLGRVDSVESLVIATPEAARDPFVLERIRKAEALFIAGGDQWNYVRVRGRVAGSRCGAGADRPGRPGGRHQRRPRGARAVRIHGGEGRGDLGAGAGRSVS